MLGLDGAFLEMRCMYSGKLLAIICNWSAARCLCAGNVVVGSDVFVLVHGLLVICLPFVAFVCDCTLWIKL